MSSMSVSAASGTQVTQGHHHRGGGARNVAAKALGMSKSDVQAGVDSSKLASVLQDGLFVDTKA